jgi:hypothetical protein
MEGDKKRSSINPRLALRNIVRGSNILLSHETGQALLHSPQVKHAAVRDVATLLENSSVALASAFVSIT